MRIVDDCTSKKVQFKLEKKRIGEKDVPGEEADAQVAMFGHRYS